jgi:hypothetical protein
MAATLAKACAGLASIVIGADGKTSIDGFNSESHVLFKHFRKMNVFSGLSDSDYSALLSDVTAELPEDVFRPGQALDSEALKEIINVISTTASLNDLSQILKELKELTLADGLSLTEADLLLKVENKLATR